MLFLMLHVAFTGFTMFCNSCVRAGPCLVPSALEPRNCATIYWRLGTAGEPTLTIYTDSFLTFFILHLRPVFFFSSSLLLDIETLIPLLFFFSSTVYFQNGPHPKGRFGCGQSFIGCW